MSRKPLTPGGQGEGRGCLVLSGRRQRGSSEGCMIRAVLRPGSPCEGVPVALRDYYTKVVDSLRLTRATLALTVGALAPALLLSTPSLATAATPSTATVVAAANTDSPYGEMDADDLRIAILHILADPDSGKRVTREANELLDDGTVEEMRAWLETGYRLAQAEDDQFAIARILADPDSGRAVVREANKALNNGSPEAARAFLETGLRLAQAEDDRVTIARMLADPDISAALRTAANAALNDNTPEALRYFLEVGQYEVDG